MEYFRQEFLSNQALFELLRRATQQELFDLSKALDPDATKALAAREIVDGISRAGANSVASWLRNGGTGYIDIVDDVADRLGVKGLPSYHTSTDEHPALSHIDESRWIEREKRSVAECRAIGEKYCERAERAITHKILSDIYFKLDENRRAAFDAKLAEHLKKYGKSGKSVAGAAGLMALANMGGFATYTFLTSVMSVISFGTLSFGAYTAATTALHVLLGPVGWTLLAAWGTVAVAGPNIKKTVQCVAMVGSIRARLQPWG